MRCARIKPERGGFKFEVERRRGWRWRWRRGGSDGGVGE